MLRHAMPRCIAVLSLIAACGSHDTKRFGIATADGQQAIKDWCGGGRLEMESKLEGGARYASANPNLLVMDCYNNGARDPGKNERGWLAIDSKTNELLELNVSVHPSTAGVLLDRALRPALDAEQKAGLDGLLTWARSNPSSVTKRWGSGPVSIVVQVYPQPNLPEPQWDIIATSK